MPTATPAPDPEVRALAERWRDLTERTITGFTGRDPGITESLGRMYRDPSAVGLNDALGSIMLTCSDDRWPPRA